MFVLNILVYKYCYRITPFFNTTKKYMQNYLLFANLFPQFCCIFFGSLIIVSKKKFSALFLFQIKDVLNIEKDLIIACWWITNLCLFIANHMYMSKRYFIIDQQIARHFVHYSKCLDNPPSLLSNSNN